MRIRNITQQLRFVLSRHEAYGQSKRAAKFGNPDEKLAKVYSHQYKKNLTDFSKQFGKWMSANHPEIKLVKDIDASHIAEYLADGKARGWADATYNANVASASKMGILVRDQYGSGHDWTEGIQHISNPSKMRSVAMTREHMNLLLDSTWMSKSESVWGMRLSEAFGLRSRESVSLTLNDIDHTRSVVHVKGKGGRDRYVPIVTPHQREVIADFELYASQKGISGSQRVLTCKPKTVDAFIRRTFEKAHISVYKDHKTGVHAIRKLWAQERYTSLCEASGASPVDESGNWTYHAKEWDQVAAELGHGRDRYELFQAYIKTNDN